ncbi:MAG: diguanylate cyclase [Clostridia bacterium]
MKFFRIIKKQSAIIISVIISIVCIAILLTNFNNKTEANVEVEMQKDLCEIRDNAIFIIRSQVLQFQDFIKSEAKTLSHFDDFSETEIINEIMTFPKSKSMPQIRIITNDGKSYSGTDGSIKKVNIEDYKDILQNMEGAISKPIYSEELKLTIVEISTPLIINGTHYGVLIGSYDIGNFEKMYTGDFLNSNCSIFFVASDGTIITQSIRVPALESVGNNVFDFYYRDDVRFIEGTVDDMKYDLNTNKQGYKAYTKGNESRYLSYAPIGINDWFVTTVSTGKTLKERSTSIIKSSTSLVIGIIIIMILLLFTIILIMARKDKAQQEELRKMARCDLLTTLYNKATTEKTIEEYLTKAAKNNTSALLMIDIDCFKQINDILGHAKGDEILAEFGTNLTKIFSDDDIIGRVGGDEFIVFIKSYNDLSEIKAIAEKIRAVINSEYVSSDNSTFKTSASIGIATFPSGGSSFDELYRNADIALYYSKNNGKNRYTFFGADITKDVIKDDI